MPIPEARALGRCLSQKSGIADRRGGRRILPVMQEDLARRARKEVARAAHAGLDWVAMAGWMGEAIRRAIPTSFQCWHTMEPSTLLLTGAIGRNATFDAARATEVLPYVEYSVSDVNKWGFLAMGDRPVGILSKATHGNPELSTRYRKLLRPFGLEHELRASFTSGGSCWGAAGFYRDARLPDFDEDEASFLVALCRHIADGFRRALLVTAPLPSDIPEGPGVLVLDPRDEIEFSSVAAERWAEELVEDVGQPPRGVPIVVLAVAARARRAGDREDGLDRSARARAYTRSGRWLILHGMRLNGPEEGRVAVTIEPGSGPEIAPLVLQAYGLSARERAVTQMVIAGRSTDDIAQGLQISPYTVQDHLKAIFEKTAVRNRRQLVAGLFQTHYWPRILTGVPPSADGSLVSNG